MGVVSSSSCGDPKRILQKGSQYQRMFTEIEKLGSGSFGVVYRVRHNVDGKEYAVKKVQIVSKEHLQSIRNEIALLARLDNHPNIVKYKNAFYEDNFMYIQMNIAQMNLRMWLNRRNRHPEEFNEFFKEFISKGQHFDLFHMNTKSENICWVCPDYLAEGNFKFNEESLGIGKQLAAALQYIHRCNVIHNDIKPENIFINSKDCTTVVQLADFGLAQLTNFTKLCKRRQPRGTLLYAAPEKLENQGGRSSDLYSVGLIFLELLMPIRTIQDFNGIVREAKEGQLPENLSKNYKKLIQRLLDKDPSKRPNAETLLGILEFFKINKIDAGHSEDAENQMQKKWPQIFKENIPKDP
ncbi:eukaryotic translation initiation factor 2-alpha kinase 1-like isoform X2 [Lutzomyia longipalpis]|uniref:eukaryotic translation initiation factor 2-alpha kinase 1-like isoform X2 n=1 Tax=Lutzomyia longipalpis TaxID=7200 RepID=UPI002483810A|nr:eukaryotic translation initiation factor 2-alpha kinase 1-like isoform X2 [Lutzomyia longipalpis]